MLSETGSGKTLSYLLPVVAKVSERKSSRNAEAEKTSDSLLSTHSWKRNIDSLIILPSNELAVQAHRMLEELSFGTDIESTLLLSNSGSCIVPKEADIVITTIQTVENINAMLKELFGNTSTVIIDEVDLTLGEAMISKDLKNPFDLVKKLKQCGVEKQFIFSAATLPRGPKSVRQQILNLFPEVLWATSAKAHDLASTLEQHWINFTETEQRSLKDGKNAQLFDMLRESATGEKMLVFANSQADIDQIYEFQSTMLKDLPNLAAKVRLMKLHSGVKKKERDQILSLFLKEADASTCDVLITGDVAARGFDFRGVGKVVQFDFATNVTTFMHRLGRTARAGSTGQAIHFVGREDTLLARVLQGKISSNADTSEDSIHSFDETVFARNFSRNRSLRTRLRKRDKI